MLQSISWFAYFILALVLGIFLFVSQGSTETVLAREIVFLFTVLALPFFDMIVQTLGKEKVLQNNMFDIEKYIVHYCVIGALIFSLWYAGYGVVSLVFWSIFLFGIVFGLNPKISFVAALILFIYIPFFLILGEKVTAEQLSIFAYYFLILGVVFQIAESVVPKIAKLGK